MFRVLERCMNDRVADEFDNLFTYPDGESRWLEIRVEPVSEGICIYSNDIHERKVWQLEMEVKARALGVQPPLTQHQWRAVVSGDLAQAWPAGHPPAGPPVPGPPRVTPPRAR